MKETDSAKTFGYKELCPRSPPTRPRPSRSLLRSALEAHDNLGVNLCAPVLVLCALGKDRLFTIVARRLDRDASRREQDGAFVASLLNQCQLTVGSTWWIRRESGDQDTAYPEGDPRRNWRKGTITEVGATMFGVKLTRQTKLI